MGNMKFSYNLCDIRIRFKKGALYVSPHMDSRGNESIGSVAYYDSNGNLHSYAVNNPKGGVRRTRIGFGQKKGSTQKDLGEKIEYILRNVEGDSIGGDLVDMARQSVGFVQRLSNDTLEEYPGETPYALRIQM